MPGVSALCPVSWARTSINHKYRTGVEYKHKKGLRLRWTPEKDAKVVELVKQGKKWKEIEPPYAPWTNAVWRAAYASRS